MQQRVFAKEMHSIKYILFLDIHMLNIYVPIA